MNRRAAILLAPIAITAAITIANAAGATTTTTVPPTNEPYVEIQAAGDATDPALMAIATGTMLIIPIVGLTTNAISRHLKGH